MKLACVDIGSNAIRLQLVSVIQEDHLVSFKKLQYIRFPLRLGKDAFSLGKIGDQTIERFAKLMRTFKLLIDLYEVDGYIARATSAMREASNGQAIMQQVALLYNLNISIISGEEEAMLLSNAIVPYLEENKNYVHIDVGGGSTEINLYANRERTWSNSYKIGTVRKLPQKVKQQVFKEVAQWVKSKKPNPKTPFIAVGTGGNINKLFKVSNRRGKNSMSLTELQAIRAYLNEYTIEQRIRLLKMNNDRADVIIPASEIYIQVMKNIGADEILVPQVGLKDGLLLTLYEKMVNGTVKDFQFLDSF